MGFTTGFTSGVTLTLGIAYLTVLAHERNRQAQGSNLRTQAYLLNSLLDVGPLVPPLSSAELDRQPLRATLAEAAKERWNAEIENAARWVQNADWESVREGAEGVVARVLGKGLEKGQQGVESVEERVEKAGPAMKEVVRRTREESRAVVDGVEAAANRAAARTLQGLHKGGEAGEKKVSEGVKEGEKKGAGVVEAVKGAIEKGIETGKKAIGKAESATENVGSKTAQKTEGKSDVQRALEERYRRPSVENKTVQQALAERYK